VTTIAWDEDSRPAARKQFASHRATTSSRTPGRVNRGTVYAREDGGLPELLNLCVCGMREESHHEGTGHRFTGGGL
jgi:hypothetical protein